MSELHAALVAALADLTVIGKGSTATIPTKAGGSYSYAYADLASIVTATRPILAEHGLVALTPVNAYDGMLAVTVHLIHTSGESLELGPFPFPRGNDAQATGSAVTYARRYALLAALGIATDDDDDGHAASRPTPQPEVETVPATVADEWLTRLNEIVDGRTRTAVKNRFGKTFGPPHSVELGKAGEVDGWIDTELARISIPADTDATEDTF